MQSAATRRPDPLARLSPEQLQALQSRIRGAAAKSSGATQAETAAIPRRATPEHRLSIEQELVWFIHEFGEESYFLNLNYPYRLKGKVNVPALLATVWQIVERHESLRTVFPILNGAP